MARKLQADEWFFAGTVALALFGVIMVYSASAVVATAENHSQYHYVIRQGVWTVVGLVRDVGRDAVRLRAAAQREDRLRAARC